MYYTVAREILWTEFVRPVSTWDGWMDEKLDEYRRCNFSSKLNHSVDGLPTKYLSYF